MPKRDYIAEITSKRSRLKKRGDRWSQMTHRLDDLIDIADFIQGLRKTDTPSRYELVKYLPIGFVSCIEGYFRLVFRDLIEYGPPFRANAAGFKDVRFGVEHVVAMHSGQFSLGDFMSHVLPANGLEDLNSSMSVLIGEPFLERLRCTKADFFSNGPESLEEMGISQRILRDVTRLFEQRHIFAHELAPRVRISVPEVRHCSQAALMFMYATECLVEELLRPAT